MIPSEKFKILDTTLQFRSRPKILQNKEGPCLNHKTLPFIDMFAKQATFKRSGNVPKTTLHALSSCHKFNSFHISRLFDRGGKTR